MATNLRLGDDATRALRREAERTGRSQQDLLREAVDRYLGLVEEQTDLDRAVLGGLVRAPTPFRDVSPSVSLPAATHVLGLLDRDDR